MKGMKIIMLSDFVIETIDLQPRSIFSIRRTIALVDFRVAYCQLVAGMEKNKIKQTGPFLSIYHEEDFNKESMDIELAVEVTQTAGENIRLLAPGLCCFITYLGLYDDFNLCFAALSEWIYREGYSISGPPIIIYIKGYMNCDTPEEFISQIYVPIRK